MRSPLPDFERIIDPNPRLDSFTFYAIPLLDNWFLFLVN